MCERFATKIFDLYAGLRVKRSLKCAQTIAMTFITKYAPTVYRITEKNIQNIHKR